jgi:hypothetical protein
LAEDYFCAFLFAMINPVVTSMRALCHASHCAKMREVCSAPLSPAAFSAAQHQFAPEVLDQVVRQLAHQALGQGRGGDARTRQALAALTAVDGTLLRAVPRSIHPIGIAFLCALRDSARANMRILAQSPGAANRNQGNMTTDFTDFADKKDRFPIRDICEIRGQKSSLF